MNSELDILFTSTVNIRNVYKSWFRFCHSDADRSCECMSIDLSTSRCSHDVIWRVLSVSPGGRVPEATSHDCTWTRVWTSAEYLRPDQVRNQGSDDTIQTTSCDGSTLAKHVQLITSIAPVGNVYKIDYISPAYFLLIIFFFYKCFSTTNVICKWYVWSCNHWDDIEF